MVGDTIECMRFGVLGPLEVADAAGSVDLGGPRQHAVLGVLLAVPGAALRADRIIADVWGPDAGGAFTASLYTLISNLRAVLGKERLVRDAAGYRLRLLDGDEIDAGRFQAAVNEARAVAATDPRSAAATLEFALGEWRGRPFEGMEDIPMVGAEAVRLAELRHAIELEEFDLLLRAGESPPLGRLEALCSEWPLDEASWAVLMRAQYRAGRQAASLRTYQRVRSLFDEELGIEPSPMLARLEEQILLHDPALDAHTAETPTNLPTYLSSFIGRRGEQERLRDAVDRHRLVTVIGPGGVGKTRLAVEVASSLKVQFPDGIWLVDLAQVADERGVGAAVAATVGATGSAGNSIQAAAAALRGQRILVILDNCEHVADAAGAAARTILEAVPQTVVLATSRIPLGLSGEFHFLLDGLDIEGTNGGPSEAVVLFSERARAIRSGSEAGGANAAAISTICRRLDGLPLSLELAAARIAVLSPTEIAHLLNRRFAVLAVDHLQPRDIHRSLEATLGWSYGLLDGGDRSAFAALGIFDGPFTAAAAAAVLNLDQHDEAVATIGRLVTMSLVKAELQEDRPTMYRLLETLRAYARDRLMETGMATDVAGRHDRYYLDLCCELAIRFGGAERSLTIARIASEVSDHMAAWERLAADDPASAFPIAWALGNHWLLMGGIAEGEQRIRDLLNVTSGDKSVWRSIVLGVGALLADRRGHQDQALMWSDEALRLGEETGDLTGALALASRLRIEQGDYEAAGAMLRRSMDLMEHAGQERWDRPEDAIADRAFNALQLADARRWQGDTGSEVRDQLYDARRSFRDLQEPEGLVYANRILVSIEEIPLTERMRLATEMMDVTRSDAVGSDLQFTAIRAMAAITWEQGERKRAEGLNRAAVRSAFAYGSLREFGGVLLQAGAFASFTGNAERAAQLFGAGQRLCGTKPGPYQPADLDRAISDARRTLGDAHFEVLYRTGRAMTAGEAASLCLS